MTPPNRFALRFACTPGRAPVRIVVPDQLIATQLVTVYLGRAGVNALAAVMGVTDVDPFILRMTQAAGKFTPLNIAAIAIAIAATSNNLVKQCGEGTDLRAHSSL